MQFIQHICLLHCCCSRRVGVNWHQLVEHIEDGTQVQQEALKPVWSCKVVAFVGTCEMTGYFETLTWHTTKQIGSTCKRYCTTLLTKGCTCHESFEQKTSRQGSGLGAQGVGLRASMLLCRVQGPGSRAHGFVKSAPGPAAFSGGGRGSVIKSPLPVLSLSTSHGPLHALL